MPNCIYKYYFHWRYEKKIIQLTKQKDTRELENLFSQFIRDNDTGCSCILGHACDINDLFMLTWGIRNYIGYIGVNDIKSLTIHGRALFISYLIKLCRLADENYLLDVLDSHIVKLSLKYIIENYNHETDREIVNHNLYRVCEIYFHIDEIPKIIKEKTLFDYKTYHKFRSILLIKSITKSNRILSANLEMMYIVYKFLFS